MFIGVIRTRDVLLHPLIILKMRGLKGFLKLFIRALSFKRYRFVGMTQQTQWIDLDPNHSKQP